MPRSCTNAPERLAASTPPDRLGVPTDAELLRLLDAHAPFGPTPLVPEVSVFYGRSLVETWEAAEQIAGRVLPAPFWAYPWAAGVGLARVILDHPHWFADQRVLDFGCGGGIAALAAARAGAQEVIANDLDPWALAVARLAAVRQGLAITLLHADLTSSGVPLPDFDIILCSDLAYEKQQAPGQRSVLEAAHRRGARVLVADAGRAYFRDEKLKLLAQFEIAVPRDLEGVEQRTAMVFEFDPGAD